LTRPCAPSSKRLAVGSCFLSSSLSASVR
jgi:hypothetical protein